MKMLAALVAVALAAMALVACGGDDDNTTTGGGGETTGATENGAAQGGATAGGQQGGALVIEADPNGGLAYEPDQASAEAGNVEVDFINPQSLVHDVVFEEGGGNELGRTELITDSDEKITLKDVKPGDYTFYCSVPGHREAGMEGTLTVE